MKLQNFTIKQINRGLKAKDFSAKELTLAYFDKIKKTDDKIGAYLGLSQNLALKQAELLVTPIQPDRCCSSLARPLMVVL